jgi:DUF4097 and DUF4098 domain-containing protein YvlB
MKAPKFFLLAVTLSIAAFAPAQTGPHPMSDAALDRVTAGGVDANVVNGIVHFVGASATPNGTVSASGSLSFQPVAPGATNTTTNGSITLSGSAQQNLQSFVNLNAVNSNVNVLLNLTVNIDSTIGKINQANLTGHP